MRTHSNNVGTIIRVYEFYHHDDGEKRTLRNGKILFHMPLQLLFVNHIRYFAITCK